MFGNGRLYPESVTWLCAEGGTLTLPTGHIHGASPRANSQKTLWKRLILASTTD